MLLLASCERTAAPPPASKAVEPAVAPVAVDAAPARLDTSRWPRLMEHGLEGMTANEMTSPAALVRALPGVRTESHATEQITLLAGNTELGSIDYEHAAATKVALVAPGIRTEHGLGIGSPIADVMKLTVRHRCEAISGYVDSFAVLHSAVRCWVGAKPARFRYVVTLENGVRPPDDVERWVAQSDQKIDLILWHRNPDPYEH